MTSVRLVAISIALLAQLGFCLPARAGNSGNAAAILMQARTAMGGSALDRVTSRNSRGRITIAGITGTFAEWSDATTGTFAELDNAGPFSGGAGFDGHHVWSQDASGLVWADGGKAGHYGALATNYVVNDDLVRPALRGSVSFVTQRTDGGRLYDVLRAVPPGGLPLQIWLDAKTHLTARAVITIGIQTSTITMTDYHSVGGLAIPFHQHTVSDTGNVTDALVNAVQLNPADMTARLAMPTSHVSDYSLTTGSATSVPMQLIDNHVYLPVMINGKGPFQFAFDTGGSNLLDSGVAKAIGLNTNGSLQGGGVGAKTEGFSFAKVARISIGNARVTGQYFAVLPIRQGFSVAAGVPIDGLIGFEVLSRFITTFDYAHLKVSFRLPSGSAPQLSRADTVPFVFNDTIPQLPCQLNQIAADCSVDTGSRASVSVLTPFIAAHPAIVPPNATAPGVNGFGIGGPALGRLGRLRSLQIGNTVLSHLIADFSVQRKGYFANPFIAANIGGGVWRRFSVTFDYYHQLMSLVPNSAFNEVDSGDRSGLFLSAPGGQFTIIDARPGTPAARAGLARGDVIVAVNGTASNRLQLVTVRKLLSGRAGTTVRLSVRTKGGAARAVSLTLRDYV